MEESILAAIVSAIVAFVTIYIKDYLDRRQQAESKADQMQTIINRYSDPILRSAYDLQSRLYNLVQGDILQKYYTNGGEAERTYMTHSTMYAVAEFLGWREILRSEVQFLRFGDETMTRQLEWLFENISQIFLKDPQPYQLFRLFRAEQRAIGEIMHYYHTTGGQVVNECLGFAEFMNRLQTQPSFAQWFTTLQADVERMANDPTASRERVIKLQHALIDLIDFFDPNYIRFAQEYRDKIPAKPEVDNKLNRSDAESPKG